MSVSEIMQLQAHVMTCTSVSLLDIMRRSQELVFAYSIVAKKNAKGGEIYNYTYTVCINIII